MSYELKPYTVVGVDTSHDCFRVLCHVKAMHPDHAVLQAIGNLNNHDNQFAANPPRELLAALTFEGHQKLAINTPSLCPRADDRPSVRRAKSAPGPTEFTVVAVDPYSGAVYCHHMRQASGERAEQDPRVDFFLIGGTLEGNCQPVSTYQPSGPVHRPTTRRERVQAMTDRYSHEYARYLNNDQPMGS